MTYLNWYKLAQSKSKSLPEMLQSLQNDYNVDPNTLDWVRSLPDREASVVIRNLLSNPSIPLERLRGFVSRSQRDRAKYQESFNPLTPDMETYARNQGEFADWLKYNLLSRKGEDREKLFQHIRENMGFVADWYNMGFQDEPESRPKLDGNLPFERAVLLSERWHDRQEKGKSAEYEPTDPRNIIKKYPNGWTWQKITSENDAIAEGNIMKHCLRESGHCEAIRLGKEIPYSLRDESNKPKVTTTFKYQHIMLDEAKGYDNADPAPYMKYLKDLFAIFKPRYSREDYLSGKLDELGMKNWMMLKPEHVETDPFLQKVANNAIIRGDEIIPAANMWAKSKLKSGQAPDEWIKGISRSIQRHGEAPDFAHDWAKEKLESGQVPQWMVDAVDATIRNRGEAPRFAASWAKEKLDSGQAPQWLIDAVSAAIQKNGHAPNFAYDWAKEKLDSGQAPQWMIDIVSAVIQNEWRAPYFAYDWVRKTLDSGQAPRWLIYTVSAVIQQHGWAPGFAKDWVKNKLESGKAPQWLINTVSEFVKKHVYPPVFATDWTRKQLESGQAPDEWIKGINRYIQKYGEAPDFAHDWTKNKLDSGQAPQWLIDAVSKFIQERGRAPDFAREWAMDKLESGQAPQWLIDAVNKKKKNKKN
jgi:hypothetical protein